MARSRLTATVQIRILREFNHLCAICGRPRPHIHHIDGDATNNAEANLLPLCPNHHLLDAHDPTERLPFPQLALFRKYRDPYILMPQFTPLLNRLQFIHEPRISDQRFEEVEARAADLVAFMRSLKQGTYYADKIATLIGWRDLNRPAFGGTLSITGEAAEFLIDSLKRDQNAQNLYRENLRSAREHVVSLVIESLRYQEWRYIPPYGDA